ncbi:hypothetical protein [Parafrankia sp. EUN1f]|uniref:hypothetical protein n=1 Tax=Parafrankia sp. EUN1f TaxID=102897 RepID=UPI0001C46CD7|nr:hypothetical protein [Parafrankia sp. EUN1f]EFC80234.1 hypothetical protein FrEUN1fDRAFT_6628 [Parafrankia sp. EUN1f]
MAVAERKPDGGIEVPATVQGDGFTGDGVTVLYPGDEGYDQYDRWLKGRGQ